METHKTAIRTEHAPAAIGPYSQAIVAPAGRLLFCSGQIALSPQTGHLVAAGDVRAQTEQVMHNIQAVLGAAGAGFADVVKSTIFLTDLGDFVEVNEVYRRYFPDPPPARSTVQAAALPRGALIEIEVVAVLR